MSKQDKKAASKDAVRKLRLLGDRLRAAAKHADQLDLKPDLKAALCVLFGTKSGRVQSNQYSSELAAPVFAFLEAILESGGIFAPVDAYIACGRLKPRPSTCPVCKKSFSTGDILHISAKIRGDAVLGPDAAQRFHASQFNVQLQALDATGTPSSELACPLCRSKLPKAWIAKECKAIERLIKEHSRKVQSTRKKHSFR